MRLAQSADHTRAVHAVRDKSATTLCGYPIGRSWEVGFRKFAKPPFPNVSCKRCRVRLGPAGMTDEQRKQALLRAVVQLEDLVRLGVETITLCLSAGVLASGEERK